MIRDYWWFFNLRTIKKDEHEDDWKFGLCKKCRYWDKETSMCSKYRMISRKDGTCKSYTEKEDKDD